MAITTPTLIDGDNLPKQLTEWAVNYYDVTAPVPAFEVKAAPGAGYALYLTEVVMSGGATAQGITLQDEDGTVLFGPIYMEIDGAGLFRKQWPNPLRLTTNKALDVLASTDDDPVICYIEGFTAEV